MSLNYLRELQKRLKKERKRLGFARQAEFAAALEIPERTYWDKESGPVFPDAEFFAKFCELGGDVMFVIKGNQVCTKHMGINEPSATYTPAQHLASSVAMLNLTEEDAAAILHIAKRLSNPTM